MFKNRWLQLGVGVPLVTCAAVVLFALWPPGPGVTKANFDRIETGMTRAEVEGLFGVEANGLVYWGRGNHRDGRYWRNADTRAEATILFERTRPRHRDDVVARQRRRFPAEAARSLANA